MIDVVILNRNLGEVCDALCVDVERVMGPESQLVVVDCSTSPLLASKQKTVVVDSEHALEFGLRFGRGMNIGINHLLNSGSLSPWILLLPVDAEIAHVNLELLLSELAAVSELVAVKPLPEGSAYAELVAEVGLGLGWNFEEGPWLVRSDYVRDQVSLSETAEFFDSDNFRGFLTSLELAFRAYANGKCVGITKHLVLRENESYLIEKADLMKTDPVEDNLRLFVDEGEAWLRTKYRVNDSWDFAQIVRLLFRQFLDENPASRSIALGGGLDAY